MISRRGQLEICKRSSSQQSHEWSPRAEKNSIGEMTFWGRVFVNVVSLKHIGMIYLNVSYVKCASFQ